MKKLWIALIALILVIGFNACNKSSDSPVQTATTSVQQTSQDASLPSFDITAQLYVAGTADNEIALMSMDQLIMNGPTNDPAKACPPPPPNGNTGGGGPAMNNVFGFGRILYTIFGKTPIPYAQIGQLNKDYMNCISPILAQMKPLLTPIITAANAQRKTYMDAYFASLKAANGLTDKTQKAAAITAAKKLLMQQLTDLNKATQTQIAAVEAQFADAKCHCYLTFLNGIRALIVKAGLDPTKWDAYVTSLKLPCNTSTVG